MKNTILLVGGDLCRRVAAALDPGHWEIFGLRRQQMMDPSIQWIQADLSIPTSLRRLPAGVSHVLYAPAPDRRDADVYRSTYPEGLNNLLTALDEDSSCLQRVVLVDSTAVWSAPDAAHEMAWIDETTPVCRDGFRAETMLAAEEILFNTLGERGVALRLAGIYGPGRTRLIDAVRNNRLSAPEGPGHWSNRIHIEDAASACVHLLTLPQPARCYIGTDGHPTRTGEFYDRLADLLGVVRPVRQIMPPSGKRLSNARLIASGWTPRWVDAVAGYQVMLGM